MISVLMGLAPLFISVALSSVAALPVGRVWRYNPEVFRRAKAFALGGTVPEVGSAVTMALWSMAITAASNVVGSPWVLPAPAMLTVAQSVAGGCVSKVCVEPIGTAA